MTNIQTVGVIGAGQMGAGIAQVAAASGYNTLLFDQSEAALGDGIQGIQKRLDRLVEKEKISQSDAESAKGNLKPSSSLSDFSACDITIEAIIENLEIKRKLFAELDEIVPANGLLTTNTSSISITNIASSTKRPEKVMGAHFMNPVPIMKLVELIRGLQTSDETYAAVNEFCNKLGKTVVDGIDSPGFVVNRILCPMINEAIFLLQEGR